MTPKTIEAIELNKSFLGNRKIYERCHIPLHKRIAPTAIIKALDIFHNLSDAIFIFCFKISLLLFL